MVPQSPSQPTSTAGSPPQQAPMATMMADKMDPSALGFSAENQQVPQDVLDHLKGQLANAESQYQNEMLQHNLNQQQLDALKKHFMAEMFKKLQELGVDPGNQESVKAFLDMLDKEDPDLKRLFEYAFDILSPEEPMPPAGTPSPGMAPQESSQSPDESSPEDTSEPPQSAPVPAPPAQ